MRRRLLNLLALLLLLLCVAVAVLWVRSYRVGSVFGYYTELAGDGRYRSVSVGSWGGRITLVPLHSKFDDGLARGRFHAWDDSRSVPQAIPGWAGFGYRRIQGREMGWMEFRVPHWFVAALLAAWPVARFVRARRRKSDPAGFPVATP
jgi:hypothetical protein